MCSEVKGRLPPEWWIPLINIDRVIDDDINSNNEVEAVEVYLPMPRRVRQRQLFLVSSIEAELASATHTLVIFLPLDA